jgi:hypothetical protein
MPFLPAVPLGKLALAASWFRSIRDRIEEIKPQSGFGIEIRETINGSIISMNAKVYELTFCKNGQPAKIKIFGPKGDISEYDNSLLG